MTPEEVMSFTGHEDYDTMKPYIAVTQKKRFHDMENCFKMGEGK